MIYESLRAYLYLGRRNQISAVSRMTMPLMIMIHGTKSTTHLRRRQRQARRPGVGTEMSFTDMGHQANGDSFTLRETRYASTDSSLGDIPGLK